MKERKGVILGLSILTWGVLLIFLVIGIDIFKSCQENDACFFNCPL